MIVKILKEKFDMKPTFALLGKGEPFCIVYQYCMTCYREPGPLTPNIIILIKYRYIRLNTDILD